MPEISRFLGIVIYMYFNEHNPPHFHVEYGEFKASLFIDTLGMMQGKLPSRVQALVVEWASAHQDELLTNWNGMRAFGQFKKIQPLV
jgi:Domain of unknown function (DUF4160)